MKNDELSRALSLKAFERAKHTIPGGVSSPGRGFAEVDYPPLIVAYGQGKFVFDLDGNRFIDFMCGLGPAILGHSNATVGAAVATQYLEGTVFGASSHAEFRLAELIVSASKFTEMVRFTCSGTEATMSALRLAKAVTGRRLVLKFKGGYHGHADTLLPGGAKRHMVSIEPAMRMANGVDPALAASTLIARYNSLETVEQAFAEDGADIAAIIVEPVASNMGVIPPLPEFLPGLRAIADRFGALLIFDEVVSGFRHRFGPIADHFNVRPDLICYGKIIGGGLPVGGYAGSTELMSHLERRGSVFQGGTFAGSPITMVAGLTQLSILRDDDVLNKVNETAEQLEKLLLNSFKKNGLPYSVQRFGSLITPILVRDCARLFDHGDVERQDKDLFHTIHRTLFSKNILLPPTIEEPIFISALHTEEDINLLSKVFVEAAQSHLAN